ncbi:hypothetical protein [Mesorhizobium sp.]|uniref:hypothetical protein n=1 Tax=Mesorhizobium sp. TaxID=1871066 RepID=UPI000FE7FF5D|nr:hypothetical protein [Mesorhizobium sp.]RWP47005.1 MAG: hypothetical protein EOR05_19490 [Mesorhizobium sp.]
MATGYALLRSSPDAAYTVERVARDLGVSVAVIQELTLGLEPEDGVGANDDDRILAFTDEGTLIAHRHLTIGKLQRALHGQSSEPSARLHNQMELDPAWPARRRLGSD